MKCIIPATQRRSSNFSFAHTQKLSREKFPHQKIFIHNHASRRFQQTSACNFASSLVLTIRILDHSSFLVQLPYHRKKLWYSSSATPHSLAIFVHKIKAVSDKKLNNDDKVLTAKTVNSFQRAWATPERANNVPHFLLHHDYFNLLRGACAQH